MSVELARRCLRPAAYERVWPGRDPDTVCLAHGDDSLKVAEAMGFSIPLRLLTDAAAEVSRCACTEGFSQTIRTGSAAPPPLRGT